MGRYSFIAVDFHHLLLAGLPAHLTRTPTLLLLLGLAFRYSLGAAAYGLLAVLFAAGAMRVRLCAIAAIVFGVMALSQYLNDAEAHRFAALTPEQQAAEIAAKKAQDAAAKERAAQEAKREEAERIARAEREKWDNVIWNARQAVTAALKDPDSAQFGKIVAVSLDGAPVACGSVNAKNSFGGYTGAKSFVYAPGLLSFEGEKGFIELWNKVCANKPIKASG